MPCHVELRVQKYGLVVGSLAGKCLAGSDQWLEDLEAVLRRFSFSFQEGAASYYQTKLPAPRNRFDDVQSSVRVRSTTSELARIVQSHSEIRMFPGRSLWLCLRYWTLRRSLSKHLKCSSDCAVRPPEGDLHDLITHGHGPMAADFQFSLGRTGCCQASSLLSASLATHIGRELDICRLQTLRHNK